MRKSPMIWQTQNIKYKFFSKIWSCFPRSYYFTFLSCSPVLPCIDTATCRLQWPGWTWHWGSPSRSTCGGCCSAASAAAAPSAVPCGPWSVSADGSVEPPTPSKTDIFHCLRPGTSWRSSWTGRTATSTASSGWGGSLPDNAVIVRLWWNMCSKLNLFQNKIYSNQTNKQKTPCNS